MVGGVALALIIGSNMLQQVPVAALAANNTGLLAIALLAFLLTRQRKVANATAIENARLYAEARQHERELWTLLEVSRTVSSTLEPQPLLG